MTVGMQQRDSSNDNRQQPESSTSYLTRMEAPAPEGCDG